MINSAAARTISELFNPEKDVTYFIPKYQREYVWGKNNWELLFDDIVSNDNNHFMGSIICINTKTDAVDNDDLELIDGQQRMTTLSILFMAIYDHLSSFKADIEDEEELSEFNSELLNLKYKLILKSDKKSLRLTPSVSGKNKQDYEHLFAFESKIMDGKFARSPSAGLRRIVKAFRYFQTRLEEQRKVGDKEFEFIFNRKENRYECTKTGGNRAFLLYKDTKTDSKGYAKKIYRSSERDCKNCPLRAECCGKVTKFKKIDDTIHKPLYDEMHEKLKRDPNYTRFLTKRRSSRVEPVLGTLINYHNMKRVNTRGIKNANKHVLMAALTYNL